MSPAPTRAPVRRWRTTLLLTALLLACCRPGYAADDDTVISPAFNK